MSGFGSEEVSFFLHADGKVVDYWAPVKGGDLTWSEENALGRQLADELFAKASSEDIGMLLPLIVADMGQIEGVEVGFLARIGDFAAHANRPAEIALMAA